MTDLHKFENLLDEIEASAIRLEELSHYHERETHPDFHATFEQLITARLQLRDMYLNRVSYGGMPGIIPGADGGSFA